MDAGIKETKEQALKEMELFKAVFDGGRLIDAHALKMSAGYACITTDRKGAGLLFPYRIGAEV